MLAKYKVAFPDDLAKSISDSFCFTCNRGQDIQSLPCPTSNESNIVLFVKKTVTYAEMVLLKNQLEKVFSPLESVLPFLEYFHLVESKIFDAFTEQELSKHFKNSDCELTVDSFVPVLTTVKKKFEQIIAGTVEYETIVSVALFFEQEMTSLISKEVEIIFAFKEFQDVSAIESVDKFRSMVILLSISEHIDALYNFCVEFKLQRCLEGQEMKKLQAIMQDKDSWQIKSISILSEVKEIFGIDDLEDSKFENLKLFQHLNTETKELRSFLSGNFRGDHFLELMALVTQALQHEEYNREVLNTLYAIYHLLAPLNDINLSFHDLVRTISELDIKKCLAQLKTVKRNIDLIRMWFNKAEVSEILNYNF